MERTDAQLAQDCLSGDGGAFDALVRRYTGDAYRFVLRLVKDRSDAEDIVQESFVKAWRHLKRYRTEQSFKTWLFTIARNTAIDWQRKRKHAAVSDFDDDEGGNPLLDSLSDDEPLPDEIFAKSEDKEYAASLVVELPGIYQEVIALRYEQDLSFEEIGEVLGSSVNTVKSRHRRALIALREIAGRRESARRT